MRAVRERSSVSPLGTLRGTQALVDGVGGLLPMGKLERRVERAAMSQASNFSNVGNFSSGHRE